MLPKLSTHKTLNITGNPLSIIWTSKRPLPSRCRLEQDLLDASPLALRLAGPVVHDSIQKTLSKNHQQNTKQQHLKVLNLSVLSTRSTWARDVNSGLTAQRFGLHVAKGITMPVGKSRRSLILLGTHHLAMSTADIKKPLGCL